MSTILYLTSIILEPGAIKHLSCECEKLQIQRPLLVTDAGIKAAGILDRVLLQLKNLQAIVFDQTPSNPTESAVRAARQLYKDQHCDGIIALGGGSSIDCAKGVAIAVSHTGPLKTYATIEGGSSLITQYIPPLVAIPTTAGTGSEVARGAILILDDGRKVGFHSWSILPKVALCDPELTLGLPPLLTAATGMDAIAHCMETFMAASFNPPADAIALDGLSRAWENIEKATRHGQDIEARLQMMSASMQGALAFQKGLGCVHSLSHSLGGMNPKLHHGTLNALFLPAVIEFNAACESMQKEKRLSKMAKAMGLPHASDVPHAIIEMNAKLGLPSGLEEIGVKPSDFPAIIQGAMADHCHKTNPRLASNEDYESMLLQASHYAG